MTPRSQLPPTTRPHSDHVSIKGIGFSVVLQGMSTSEPLASVLKARGAICHAHSTELVLRHVPGKRNGLADTISRWNGEGDSPLPSLTPEGRMHISLSDILEAVS